MNAYKEAERRIAGSRRYATRAIIDGLQSTDDLKTISWPGSKVSQQTQADHAQVADDATTLRFKRAMRTGARLICRTALPGRPGRDPQTIEVGRNRKGLLKKLMRSMGLMAICFTALNCHQLDEHLDTTDTQVKSSIDTRRSEPLRALYLTSYGNRWHDYRAQHRVLFNGISRYVNVEFTLVGKSPEDTLQFMEQPNFAAGYDVVVYNMCFPDETDPFRIDNIISQTRDLGIGAVLLHCAMHSFRDLSPKGGDIEFLAKAMNEWETEYDIETFPHWWAFTGIDTVVHDWQRSMQAQRVSNDHPLTRQLPEIFETAKDELYRVMAVKDSVVPLYEAYSPETNRDHLVAWTHPVGEGHVFATTLGHAEVTMGLSAYHRLVAQGMAFVTETLAADGYLEEGVTGTEVVDNYQGTVTCKPGDVIEADSVADIQSAVAKAHRSGRSLKVISVKRSNSNNGFVCPQQGGILLNLAKMNRVLEIDDERMTVRVEPGVRAEQLSQALHEQGFAIRAMPDYTGVSIGGGIATAAHHSSLQIPASMADMVVSMKIVDAKGQLHNFSGEQVAAVATHVGVLGVVVEVELTIEPQFKLAYGHQSGRDDELEDIIEDEVRRHDYARVMWFAGNGRYVMDYYDRVPNDTPGTSRHNLWSSSGSIFKFVGDLPYQVLNRAPLRAQCDSALIRSKVWLPPIARRESRRGETVGWSHEMLGSACEPGTCPWDSPNVKSRTMEAAFPLSRLKAWMGDVRAILDKNRACFPILGIYLRFSKASDRWLAFNYGEDVVAFEIHVPKVADETYFERSAAVYDEIMYMTRTQYAGRPHWGKNSSPVFVDIGPDEFERFDEFVALKNQLDPQGRFDNKLWRIVTGRAEPKRYPGCALSRDCICETDSDCGTGYSCESGGVFPGARTCR
ncbi:MAG: FAD-binding protein [Bradymonadia bacterium]